MAVYTSETLRTLVHKAVPRLNRPTGAPTSEKEMNLQQTLREQAKANLKKLGGAALPAPSRGGRTWNYEWNGGSPTATIFATGKTVSLPAGTAEDKAIAVLAKMGIRV